MVVDRMLSRGDLADAAFRACIIGRTSLASFCRWSVKHCLRPPWTAEAQGLELDKNVRLSLSRSGQLLSVHCGTAIGAVLPVEMDIDADQSFRSNAGRHHGSADRRRVVYRTRAEALEGRFLTDGDTVRTRCNQP